MPLSAGLSVRSVLSPPNPDPEETARRILDERFARGEIIEEGVHPPS